MAHIKTIWDDVGNEMGIINIDNTVGANGVNNPGDVMVIKALFNWVPKKESADWMGHFGDQSWNVASDIIPYPDGTMWGVVELTKSFQKYANKLLSNYGSRVNVSGRMKPVNSYALVGKNYSTIAALNLFASFGAPMLGNYVEAIVRYYGLTYLLEEEDYKYGD